MGVRAIDEKFTVYTHTNKNTYRYFSQKNYSDKSSSLIYLSGVSRRFQHYTGHITMGSFVGRRNQYIQLVMILYSKLLTIGEQVSTFPHNVRGLNCRPKRWEKVDTCSPMVGNLLYRTLTNCSNGLH